MNFNLEDYESNLLAVWQEINAKTGIQYFTAVDLGLEPMFYPFLTESIDGYARLNFKVWNNMILTLYFQNDEGFFKINTFFKDSYAKRYRPKDLKFDFRSTNILGRIFYLKTSINYKGNISFDSAELISFDSKSTLF